MNIQRTWLDEIREAIKDPEELLHFLNLDLANFKKDLPARQLFPLFVPRAFAEKMQKGNPKDPLFLQVMANRQEFIEAEGFTKDPLDEQHPPVPNILHKYQNRLLFMIKNSCGVNCRYCFRRHFPYAENKGTKANWLKAIDYIREHTEIEEVVFSGGDPLMAKDEEWAFLINQLSQIPHLKRLRIHSRLPVVIPQRITNEFCQLLKQSRFQWLLVTHINHPNEIDEAFIHAMEKLKASNVTLLNQSVLLKGVNDEARILKALSEKLFEAHILPYYLHLLDKVAGANHFYISDAKALMIYRQLQAITSGYLVPKLAREIGGEKNKTLFS